MNTHDDDPAENEMINRRNHYNMTIALILLTLIGCTHSSRMVETDIPMPDSTLTATKISETETVSHGIDSVEQPERPSIAESPGPQQRPATSVYLDSTDYRLSDTGTYASILLPIRNRSDSMFVIERAVPSCGCIMATVQRSFVRKDKPGQIYIAIQTDRMDYDQPYTVDIYTTANPSTPLTVHLRKATNTDHTDDRPNHEPK